jgi:biopolymer transport protein TolR
VALSLDSSNSRRGRRRGRGRRALAEINVTPLVDVMLVLLIIFMISAPLLTAGVPIDLPKTEASAMDEQSEPLNISIKADGSLFLGDTAVRFEGLGQALRGLGAGGFTRPIYVRADGHAPYEKVAQVMAALSPTPAGHPRAGQRPKAPTRWPCAGDRRRADDRPWTRRNADTSRRP